MIIPSIDLLDGKAVQLRQGRELVLTSDRDPVALAREFSRYGEVAVIDLDAARGQGDNLDLIKRICRVAQTRVGGGIRDHARARELLRAGADRLIIGTAAEPEFLETLPAERIIVALDHREGIVVDRAWTNSTGESVHDRAHRLAPYCSGFLCTFVDAEGGMSGLDPVAVAKLKRTLPRPLTVAGGVSATMEAVDLLKSGVDVQVGMALYTGALDLADTVAGVVDFQKNFPVPTIVQNCDGQVLMLAYSTPESLRRALREGRGVYFSRSRNTIWEKGATSGNTQELLSCRTDCDRDTLLFTVRQRGAACHTGSYGCFGGRQFTPATLFDTLRDRKLQPSEASFSAQMFDNRTLLLRKVMEEAYEVTIAGNRDEYIWEIADLVYFLSVLAVDEGIDWSEILTELRGRQK